MPDVEPRHIWLNEYPTGLETSWPRLSLKEAEAHAQDGCIRQVEFVEVIPKEIDNA